MTRNGSVVSSFALSCYDKHHSQKQLREGKGLFQFTLSDPSLGVGEVTAVARAGIEAETMSAYRLVLWLTRFLLQYNPACPGNGTAHSGLCPSASVISQDTLLQT